MLKRNDDAIKEAVTRLDALTVQLRMDIYNGVSHLCD